MFDPRHSVSEKLDIMDDIANMYRLFKFDKNSVREKLDLIAYINTRYKVSNVNDDPDERITS
jgi:hypothetical protein